MRSIGTIISSIGGDGPRTQPSETKALAVTGPPSAALRDTIQAARRRQMAIDRGWTDGRNVVVSPEILQEAEIHLRDLEMAMAKAGEMTARRFFVSVMDMIPSCENMPSIDRKARLYCIFLAQLPAACLTDQTMLHIARAAMTPRGTFLPSYAEIESILVASIQPQRDLAAGLRAVISAGQRQQCNERLLTDSNDLTPEAALQTVAYLERCPPDRNRASAARIYLSMLEERAPGLVEQSGPPLRRLLAAAPVRTVEEQLRVVDAATTPADRATARRAYLSRQHLDAAYAAARGEAGTTPVTTDSVKSGDHRTIDGGPTGGVRHSTGS